MSAASAHPPPARAALPEGAELIHPPEAVAAAYDRMARDISARLHDREPVVIAVMVGGLIPAGQLLTRLDFPLIVDYLHATRYRGGTRGERLEWLARPRTPLAGRTVLVVDDILDEGITLAAILEHCRAAGAAQVLSAVLVDKRHDRKPALRAADFTGLEVPDRYVFGCGMDYRGGYRHLRGIYALAPHSEG